MASQDKNSVGPFKIELWAAHTYNTVRSTLNSVVKGIVVFEIPYCIFEVHITSTITLCSHFYSRTQLFLLYSNFTGGDLRVAARSNPWYNFTTGWHHKR